MGGQHGVCPVDCPSLGCCWGPEPVSPGVVQEPALESEPGHGPDGCAWKRPGWGVRRRHSRSEPGWGSLRRKPQPPAAQAGGPVRGGGSLLEGVFRETGRESGAGSLGWHGDRGVTGLGSTWRLRRSQRRGVWTRGKFRTSGTEVRVTTGAWVAALRGHGKWMSDPRTPRASGLPSMFNSLPRDQTPQMLQARQL